MSLSIRLKGVLIQLALTMTGHKARCLGHNQHLDPSVSCAHYISHKLSPGCRNLLARAKALGPRSTTWYNIHQVNASTSVRCYFSRDSNIVVTKEYTPIKKLSSNNTFQIRIFSCIISCHSGIATLLCCCTIQLSISIGEGLVLEASHSQPKTMHFNASCYTLPFRIIIWEHECMFLFCGSPFPRTRWELIHTHIQNSTTKTGFNGTKSCPI